jgi:hypothetical protein
MSKESRVRIANFVILAVLLFVLYLFMGCQDDDCYEPMHVVELKSWECFQGRGLDCGDIDFPTEEEWLDQYGRVWEVRCEYANMTIGKFHYKPVK